MKSIRRITVIILVFAILALGGMYIGVTEVSAAEKKAIEVFTESKTCNVFGEPAERNTAEHRTKACNESDTYCFGTVSLYVDSAPVYMGECQWSIFAEWTDFSLCGVSVDKIKTDSILNVASDNDAVCSSVMITSAPGVNGISEDEDRYPLLCYLKFYPIAEEGAEICTLNFEFTATAKFIVIADGSIKIAAEEYSWSVPHYVKTM